ncbi:transporter [Ganoderma sinense ZZ0214-1]|uniref:Transporter n=1 Tax=Ganoderma sinense ZZ0214-1 TaxID=1077348 RepID=A0A2G8SBP1_9APHY|nr:transporter [Ganoderma sinense ZZ0214-1]
MPRENSFSDSEGRSLTPDPEDEFVSSPVYDESTADKLPDVRPSAAHPDHSAPPILEENHAQQPHAKHGPTSAPTSPTGPGPTSTQRPAFMTPKDRFRSAVRKVMAMRTTSSFMARRGIGAEPGVDPRRASAFLNYGHIRQQCLIEVNDYSTMRTSFGRMTNAEFVRLLADDKASLREPWVRVRWINIGGISWDVISALALKYDLHPLALEDVLTQRGHARSKADYYPQHLFIRMLNHTLAAEDERASTSNTTFAHLPRSESPAPMDEEQDPDEDDSEYQLGARKAEFDVDEKTVYGGASADASRFSTMNRNINDARGRGGLRRRFGSTQGNGNGNGNGGGDVESRQAHAGVQARFAGVGDERAQKDARNRKLLRELKRGDRVNVKIQPMCLFLFRDGTVISIHKDNTLSLTAPITERLRVRDTGLRTTADPSLLVQSLLDLVVDQALEVVEEYQTRILKIEQAVLLKPSMKTVRRLHILQGDLILHKRTLEPIKTVIYGLRRYDIDRVLALREHHDSTAKVEGYMSHKSKIYLADVHDHMEYILTSLDMIAGITENLINYTFNMASYEMNEVMRRLTLATIIFLPLTLLTGYFGMNFTPMWSVNNNSDLLFWEIAIPVMIVVIPLFLWGDFKRMGHYFEKRLTSRKIKKSFK